MALARSLKPSRFTQAEYLAFERAATTRHEYIDGILYMPSMTGTVPRPWLARAKRTAILRAICLRRSIPPGWRPLLRLHEGYESALWPLDNQDSCSAALPLPAVAEVQRSAGGRRT